jgi:hypothetical protein
VGVLEELGVWVDVKGGGIVKEGVTVKVGEFVGTACVEYVVGCLVSKGVSAGGTAQETKENRINTKNITAVEHFI